MNLAPLLVLMTCLVASVSYIGAVTHSALVTMVLPLVAVVGAVAVWLRTRTLAAVWTVVVLSAGGGEIVNIISGSYQGSVARSAGAASLCTGLAVLASATRRPATFLFPVAAIVIWALALGAGGRVELVSIVAGALALLALAAVERDMRAFASSPRLAPSVLLAMLLLVGAGVVAAQFQLHHDGRSAASPFRQSLATTIEPPAILSLTRHPPPSATQPVAAPGPTSVTSASHHTPSRPLLRVLGWTGLGLALLLIAALAARLFWVALAWRRLRRRLERHVEPAAAGAWTWTVASLGRLGSPIPLHVSPDLAMSEAGERSESLRDLARLVTPAVFDAPGSVHTSQDFWPQAQAVVQDASDAAGRLRRVRARWQAPSGTVCVR